MSAREELYVEADASQAAGNWNKVFVLAYSSLGWESCDAIMPHDCMVSLDKCAAAELDAFRRACRPNAFGAIASDELEDASLLDLFVTTFTLP